MSEFVFHRKNDVIQLREIPIMEASPTRQLPDALDGIQLRAICREEVEGEMFDALLSPLKVKTRMVESGVIRNHYDASSGAAADSPKLLEKLPAGEGVEFTRLASKREFAVSQADGGEIPYTAPRRMMEQHRVLGFGRDPQAATRTVLLKMHFVHGPKIDRRISA